MPDNQKYLSMKKILLTIIYPFWFFFSKTWIGNVYMIPIALCPIPILVLIIFPECSTKTREEAQTIGIGLTIISLVCAPYIFATLENFLDKIETNYENWNYKTNLKNKKYKPSNKSGKHKRPARRFKGVDDWMANN